MARVGRGTSICISSCKGGVGKTTLALHLAGVYENLEKKTLLIDLDVTSGGIATSLNLHHKEDIFTLFQDLQMNYYKGFKKYVTPYDTMIDVLPCPIDPRSASKMDPSLMAIVLEQATLEYDVVILDTTHVVNQLNLYTWDACDYVTFLVTNDAIDLKNIKSMLTIFKDLEATKYKIVLNDSLKEAKGYFSNYDIKNIIKANIDYSLSRDYYIKNYDQYIMDGKIVTLDKKVMRPRAKDYQVLLTMALDMLGEK